MFNEDNWDEDAEEIQDIIAVYEALKQGSATRLLDVEEFELLIDYFFQENKEPEAFKACNLALEYYPVATTIKFFKAELLFHSQKLRQALVLLDEVEALEPQNLDVILLKSEIFVAQMKPEEAALYLTRKIVNFKGREKIDLLLELVDVYDECEEYEKIFDTLETVLSIDKRNEEALHKISFWSDYAGLQERSALLFKKILDEDPYNAIAWFNLGVAYQGLKMFEDAVEAYEYCTAIDDSFEFAFRNMADASIRLKWYDKAIESLERNLELGNPEDVIFEALGLCFEKQKDFEKARYYYRKAIQLNPSDDKMFFKIGESYFKEQDYAKAKSSIAVAIQLNKENAMYFVAFANCLLELEGEETEIVNNFLHAIKLKPTSKTVWSNFMKGLFRMELYESMYENSLLYVDMDDDRPEFEYYTVAALIKLGKVNEALVRLGNVLHIIPKKVKMLTELDPAFLQRKAIVDLISGYNSSNNQ